MPLDIEPEIFTQLAALGWRRGVVPKSRFLRLAADHASIDCGGSPLYASTAFYAETVCKLYIGFAMRADEIPWEDSFTEVSQVWRDTQATPFGVPLHPGAERLLHENFGWDGRCFRAASLSMLGR